MKKSKNKNETPELNLDLDEFQVMDQVKSNEQAYAVTHQIQDDILQTVASKMWEKELLQTYKNKYTSNYSMMYGVPLYGHKFDRRGDDKIMTPKRSKTIEQKQKIIIKDIQNKKGHVRELSNSIETEDDCFNSN
jgi:hypothetical protein